ncbi:LemA family protein [Phycisphaerae bacterium RAS2]|nr:LemA family protein [Phycisphaerae bacterium RAS2]
MAIWIAIGAAVVFVGWFVLTYNSLVALRNRVKNAWSQIDVQLKRRHDLIPNLVETVKGYAGHEKSALEGVTQARAAATNANGIAASARAEGELSNALSRLLMVAEQYPDLKANTNFLSLQEELASTENRIGFSRQHFNDSVMGYNNKVQSFPANIVAGMFNFEQEEFFELDNAAAREAPKVSFS